MCCKTAVRKEAVNWDVLTEKGSASNFNSLLNFESEFSRRDQKAISHVIDNNDDSQSISDRHPEKQSPDIKNQFVRHSFSEHFIQG
jgi:hypothetical protein